MRMKPARLLFLVTLILAVPGCAPEGAPLLIELETPAAPPSGLVGEPSYDFMLDSYARNGDLHVMTLCGDFQALMEVQHWGIMLELDRLEPKPKPRRAGCSMFQCPSDSGGALVGRNFDHRAGDMLVAWTFPDSGYASLGFIPMNQWAFNPDNPFNPDDPIQKRYLLLGAMNTIEGMNARGVTVTLASLDRHETLPDPDRKPRFLLHLVREILDYAGTLDEAIAIAERYNVFDNGRTIISHHIFLADPVNGSAVLEWSGGEMEVLRSGPSTQVVTNRPLFETGEPSQLSGPGLADDSVTPLLEVPDKRLRNSCPRYNCLAKALEAAPEGLNWQTGMQALKAAAQKDRHVVLNGEPWVVNTEWSAIFDMTRKEAYVCVDRKFDVVYKLKVPTSGGL